MEIQPLNERILVKREPPKDKSKGGIIIPDTHQEPPVIGKVLAVGSGAILQSGERRPLDVAVGDRVLFSKHAGIEIEVDGEKLLIMGEHDVHARVVGEELVEEVKAAE